MKSKIQTLTIQRGNLYLSKVAHMFIDYCSLPDRVLYVRSTVFTSDELKVSIHSVGGETVLYRGPIRKFRGGWIESDGTDHTIWTDGKRLIVR